MRTPMGRVDPLTPDERKKMSAELRRNKKGAPSGKKGLPMKKYRVPGTNDYFYSYAS